MTTAGPLAEIVQPLRAFDFHADRDALEVQDDVGDVFTHTCHARKLVQNVVDLHGCDRGALQRRHQDAAQCVAERQTKAALQRFGDQRCLAVRVIARLDVQLLRFDQLSPILVDHASLLNSSSQAHVRKRGTPEVQKIAIPGRSEPQPGRGNSIRRGGASAGGSHCGPSA